MFCPNCGASNSKKQKYCRFCGLNLEDTSKSLMNQLIFGEDSKLLKTLSSTRRTVDSASTVLVEVTIVGLVAYYFFAADFGKDLVKLSLGFFFLLKIIREIIGYFQRRERSRWQTNKFGRNTEQLESGGVARLPEQRPFEPAPNVVENATELLPIENSTRKFD